MDISPIEVIGQDLKRPESVLATASGAIYVSDLVCGAIRIGGARHPMIGAPADFVPNGIALLPNGEFLIANIGPSGGVWKLTHDHRIEPVLLRVGDQDLTSTNFVCLDNQHDLWITVSTRLLPRERSFRRDAKEGYIVRVDKRGARIVADGLGFLNECQIDPSNRWLYVNETFTRRLSRFPIDSGELGQRETVFEFGSGDFPDGLTFDSEGAVWVTCVVSNRLLRVTPDGQAEVILGTPDLEAIDEIEREYQATGRITRASVNSGNDRPLRNISSLAFAGPDLRTVILGCIAGTSLPSFRSPIAGHPPVHWKF